MPKVTISEDMYKRIAAFKQVVEAVLEEPTDLDTCIELLLSRALECMLVDILGEVNKDTLLKSLQQLASLHPEAVYKYMAEVWKGGEEIEREKTKRKMGLIPPSKER